MGPTVVLTVLVRDEEDILEANLEYHLAQGVDHVIATDNGSVDGTMDILNRFQKLGCLTLIREPDDDYSQSKWVTRMARMAFTTFAAAWVINGDADEFWWPSTGNLKSTLEKIPAQFGAVNVPRVNFVPRPADGASFHERMTVREAESRNALGEPLPPKACHRGRHDVVVAMGNHDARGSRLEPFFGQSGMTILHFPMRSYKQFANKIRKGGEALARNRALPPGAGATWRHLYQLLEVGGLTSYYYDREVDDVAAAREIAQGRLLTDTRLREFMRGLEPTREPVLDRSALR